MDHVRRLLAHLPQNNLADPPRIASSDPAGPDGPGARRRRARRTVAPVRHARRAAPDRGRRRVLRDPARVGRQHPHRVRAARRSAGRDRRAAAGGARRRARHRRVGEGGALRAHVRCVQRPDRHVRRRPRIPARRRAGARRDHQARREAALRLLRGDGAQGDGDHAQGVRRRVRRHEQQAHPRRHELRVAHGGDRGDGRGGRGQHHLQGRDRGGRGPGRRSGGAWSRSTRRSSRTRTSPRPAATSTR